MHPKSVNEGPESVRLTLSKKQPMFVQVVEGFGVGSALHAEVVLGLADVVEVELTMADWLLEVPADEVLEVVEEGSPREDVDKDKEGDDDEVEEVMAVEEVVEESADESVLVELAEEGVLVCDDLKKRTRLRPHLIT